MPTIERQLELEQRMVDSGAQAYLRAQREAEAAGRGFQLDYAQTIIKQFVQPLSEALREWCNAKGPSSHGRARIILRMLDPEKAIFITLRNLFSSFTREQSPADIAHNIGKMVEDEMRFTKFQQDHGAYYDAIIKDFARKGTQDYRHMHRVLTHKANEKGSVWTPWPNLIKVEIGTRLLNLVITETDLCDRKDIIVKNRNQTMLVPSAAGLKFVRDHEEIGKFMHPTRMPCIIPPDPWVSIFQGGYYSPQLRSNVQMIKAKQGHRAKKKTDLSRVMRAINAMQNVSWSVNTKVLDVLTTVWKNDLQIGLPSSNPLTVPESPVKEINKDAMTDEQRERFIEWKREASQIYTADKERVAKTFQVIRVIRMAQEYAKVDKFWFVWYADFRGRLYSATAGFSPQGPDFAKGLLQFANGKPLGERGWYWLRVHIANRFGYDKVSYDDRVAWVDAQAAKFCAVADDPLSHREVWGNADKPYQFLAALFEYAAAVRSNVPHTYVSRLPIGLDGSCNGLQNFSAMLRDPVGGAATNLVPGDTPSDIYAKVADVLVRKVKWFLTDGPATSTRVNAKGDLVEVDNRYFAQKWLQYGIDRKLAKRPVMTLPYGATQQSCTSYIFAELIAKNRNLFGQGVNFQAAMWLTPLLWKSIGEVVVAAREAMDWLQKAASALTKDDRPIEWTTADGFVALQQINTIETKQIDTQLAGRFQCRVGEWTNELDRNKQRLGVSPNFVHSMDATHMRMTINALLDAGIDTFSFIHDDYGTYAADTDTMHRIIREQFVKLYTEHNPLHDFKAEHEKTCTHELPEIPKTGTLDMHGVLNSLYFFG